MSRLFAHSAYAEDQPQGYTILSTHVATRGVTTGTLIALGVTTVRTAIPALRRPATMPPVLLSQRILTSAASGTVWGVGLSLAVLALRMRGRETIEWQDRSWRLLENQGQLETDDWTYGGMLGGALAAVVAARRGAGTVSLWTRVVGGMGLGSIGGMVGYMAWRYGVHGGKFPEAKSKDERTAV